MKCCEHGWTEGMTYAEVSAQKKSCPKCSGEMKVAWVAFVIDTYPETYTWYWECDCGHTELGAHWSCGR